MIQAEVGKKITADAVKKSYLYWLLNYGYLVSYVKTVPPQAFSPAPQVVSCLVCLQKKEKSALPQVSFELLKPFLDLVAPYPRKTLGAILKQLQKQELNPSPIPLLATLREQDSPLLKKRLEALSREELAALLPNPSF